LNASASGSGWLVDPVPTESRPRRARRVVVLGSSGFIGRAVLATGAEDAELVGVSARGDLPSLIDGLRPDAVINAVGCAWGAPSVLREANVDLVRRLLEVAVPRGVRVVQVGSAAEYGQCAARLPWRETDTEVPTTAYGRTKLEACSLLREAHAAGADVVSLRVFNVVGPSMPAGSPIVEFLDMVATGRVVIGNASTARDYVTARFVATALLSAASAERPSPDPVVNVCSGRATTMAELVAALARALCRHVVIEDRGVPVPIPVAVGDPRLLRDRFSLTEELDAGRLARAVVTPWAIPADAGAWPPRVASAG
jgi:NDP-hexose 4-ketoreductase